MTFTVSVPGMCRRVVQYDSSLRQATVYYCNMSTGLIEFDGSQTTFHSHWLWDSIRMWLNDGATITAGWQE